MDSRRVATATLIGLLATGTAFADHGARDFRRTVDRHRDYGRVVDVEPIVRRVVVDRPRQECWQDVEYRSAAPARIAATTFAGGVIGAVIGHELGHQLSHGRGHDALALAGAVAGSAVANQRARRNLAARGEGAVAVPVERCRHTVERVAEDYVDGYWVTYRYRGRLHRVRTREHPGDRIGLQVSARPVARF